MSSGLKAFCARNDRENIEQGIKKAKVKIDCHARLRLARNDPALNYGKILFCAEQAENGFLPAQERQLSIDMCQKFLSTKPVSI